MADGLARISSLSWWALLTFAVLALGSCSKFHAIQPSGSNEDLLFVMNDSTLVANNITIITPREMPPGPPLPFSGPPVDVSKPPQQVVKPDFGKNEVLSLQDGVVELANINIAPYKYVGRLVSQFPFDKPDEGHSCTAQIIGDSGVLLTAAHCVYDLEHRQWARSHTFSLRFDQGASAQTFGWECSAILSGWPNGSRPHDYAMIKLRGVSPGGMGMTINAAASRVDSVGYPAKPQYYSTQRMVHVFGQQSASNPTAMKNDMLEGSSGGGLDSRFKFYGRDKCKFLLRSSRSDGDVWSGS
jgi:V8-like Glu-specific endopeptidase